MLVGVTIVVHEVAKVFCALLHDREDGPAFGRLVANEIISSFVEVYGGDLTGSNSSGGRNLKDFRAFHPRIIDVMRHSFRPVLNRRTY